MQQAPNWLEENQDKPLEELQASKATGDGTEDGEEAGAASIPAGTTASSLVCIELGKKLRNRDLVSFHASQDPTGEIEPLTEEEKKAKLEELRQKLEEKRRTSQFWRKRRPSGTK
ncbi:hypothetical protein VTI28DRAFT_3206 [Corynascus sepedonium]